jgi:anti-sigma factor RsiW
MNTGSPELERLISRYIDDEATPAERRDLEARADADPAIDLLLIETAAIDREVGRAMRIAMDRTIPLPVRRSTKVRWFQAIGFAAAACIALVAYLNFSQKPGQPARGHKPTPARASWFATQPPQVDVVEQVDPADVRPELRLRDTDRHWIVIPARQPGQFLLIQVDRLRTRAIRIQDDF